MNKDNIFFILPEQIVNLEDLGEAGRIGKTESI